MDGLLAGDVLAAGVVVAGFGLVACFSPRKAGLLLLASSGATAALCMLLGQEGAEEEVTAAQAPAPAPAQQQEQPPHQEQQGGEDAGGLEVELVLNEIAANMPASEKFKVSRA